VRRQFGRYGITSTSITTNRNSSITSSVNGSGGRTANQKTNPDGPTMLGTNRAVGISKGARNTSSVKLKKAGSLDYLLLLML